MILVYIAPKRAIHINALCKGSPYSWKWAITSKDQKHTSRCSPWRVIAVDMIRQPKTLVL